MMDDKNKRKRISTIIWSLKLAWKIDKKILLFWFGLSIFLSVLPAISLMFNRNIISSISLFILNSTGSFSDVIYPVIILGIILTISGLSSRLNGDLLYMMMYDSYYLGMEELMMDTIQTIDRKTLLNKDLKDEYNAIIIRGGSLTDFISALCTFISKITNLISLLIVILPVSIIVFGFSLIYILFVIYFNAIYTENLRDNTSKLRDSEHRTSYLQNIPQKLGIAKELRIYGIKNKIDDIWKSSYNNIEDFKIKQLFGTEIRTLISGVIFYLFTIGIIIYSLFQILNDTMTPDVLLMIFVLCQNISSAISGIAKNFLKADYGLFSLERQMKFINNIQKTNQEKEKDIINVEHIEPTPLVFELKNVSFSYDDNLDHFVLKDINLKINEGETIALVGYNGSGKTTLVKLLLGIYKQTQGELLFNGKPYTSYDKDFIKSRIGTFFQNFYIFHASVKENVGFGDIENIDDESKINNAIVQGGAEKIISKLPLGIENWLGKDVEKDGAILSGGEKQKIAVSKTYMSDKNILIFDEPAAALDPIAEMEQFSNIKNKAKGKTAILISHRVGFARLADRIIVLDQGEIIEDGSHDQLIKQNGLYSQFYFQQSQWYETFSEEKFETED